MSRKAVLILCGGSGTRLWPLSTEDRPKQFLPLVGDRSLFQQTVDRLRSVVDDDSLWVATVERYVPLIMEQAPELDQRRILVEPARRNTAPAIATAHAMICEELGEHRLGVFPSDHFIADAKAFGSAVGEAFEFADHNQSLVTLAIPPTRPETGFGYLRMGEQIRGNVRRVEAFVEKPDEEAARGYIESGRYAWNGGMFLWESDAFDHALDRYAPEIHQLAHDIAIAPGALDELYAQMPSISIDYAVMEKADNVVTVAAEYGWSDVGSWTAVAELSSGSTDGVIRIDSSSWVSRGTSRTIAIAGADDLIVVDTPDALLILNRNAAGEMRKIAEAAEKVGDRGSGIGDQERNDER